MPAYMRTFSLNIAQKRSTTPDSLAGLGGKGWDGKSEEGRGKEERGKGREGGRKGEGRYPPPFRFSGYAHAHY